MRARSWRALVNRLIDRRVAEGELNDCNLTFRELQTIKEIFLHILQGVHHPRIQYPEPVARSQQAEAQPIAGTGEAEKPASGESAGKEPRVPVPGSMEEPAGI